jgi:diguanylate cyclase (GGDEF)-like protein
MFQRLDRWMRALPPAGVWGLGLALTALAGAIDVTTGPEISPAVLYLGPVGFAAWYGGRRTGLAFTLLSALVLYTADRLSGGLYSHTSIPLWNATSRFGIFLVTVGLATGLRRSLVHAEELASTDHLTGIANRRSFYRAAENDLERARRYGRPLTLAYIDLDNFKQLNDRVGHHAGDQALQATAQILRGHVRRLDLVARLGGDEFTILLPETDQPQARTVLEKLRPLLADEMRRHGWEITCSIGVVTAAPPPPTLDALLRRADQLMYRVKHGSKDAVLFEVEEPEAGSSSTPS